ncbi:MAG: ATP-binding cassette domain-containing protein [Acidimicrobiales bacterium]
MNSPTPSDERIAATATGVPAMEFIDVSVVIGGNTIIDHLDLVIGADDHWVVLGPNGGGKSTLVRLAALQQHPSSGTLRLLGHELGRIDIRPLRSRIGITSAGSAERIRGELECGVVVMCGRDGVFEPWWHTYGPSDAERASRLLAQVGLDDFDTRPFATLSSGERQRALLARSLMADPSILLLDEPTSGLDFGGRERLVEALRTIADDPDGPATMLVVHHAEDIPPGTTHVLGLGAHGVVAQGPIESVLTSELMSELYGLDVTLTQIGERYSASARLRAAISSSDTSFSNG